MSLLLVNGDGFNLGSPAYLDNMTEGTYLSICYRQSNAATHTVFNKDGAKAWNVFTAANFTLQRNTTGVGSITLQASALQGNFAAYGLNKWLCTAARFKMPEVGGVQADQALLIGDYVGNSMAEPSAYATQTAGVGTVTDDSAGNMVVGTNPPLTVAFDGRIALFAIWNRHLSDAELIEQQFFPHPSDGCVLFVHVWEPANVIDIVNATVITINGVPTLADHAPYDLIDDFDDDVITPALWNTHIDGAGGATVAEVGSKIVVTPALNQTGNNHASIRSISPWDMTGNRYYVQIPKAISGTSVIQYFIVSSDAVRLTGIDPADNWVGFWKQGANVHVKERVGGAGSSITTFPYAAVSQRYFAIRESGGTTFWETSPDSINWTVQHSEANLIDMSAVYIELRAGTFGSSPNATTAEFDALNTIPNEISVALPVNSVEVSLQSLFTAAPTVLTLPTLEISVDLGGSLGVAIELDVLLAQPELIPILPHLGGQLTVGLPLLSIDITLHDLPIQPDEPTTINLNLETLTIAVQPQTIRAPLIFALEDLEVTIFQPALIIRDKGSFRQRRRRAYAAIT